MISSFFVQAVWKAIAVQWCPVWTACPALWSGSPPITAACCRLLTAQDPHRRQLCRWVKQALPRRPLRSRLRLPVRTPAWFTKSYRPSHIDIQLGHYNKFKKSPNLVKPSSHKNTHTHTLTENDYLHQLNWETTTMVDQLLLIYLFSLDQCMEAHSCQKKRSAVKIILSVFNWVAKKKIPWLWGLIKSTHT